MLFNERDTRALKIKARYKKHVLHFKFPAGTSRGVLQKKETFFLLLESEGRVGIGECSTIPGLSMDYSKNYEEKIEKLCNLINKGPDEIDYFLRGLPSLKFGLETATIDLQNGGERLLFPGNFTAGKTGIPINGLIWMGEEKFMLKQIEEKLDEGFTCLKMKVGALNFEKELKILNHIRENFSAAHLEIRLDANGAFSPDDVYERLDRLNEFSIHSIEQPIKPKQFDHMEKLCVYSPIPVAFDEELIGLFSKGDKMALLHKMTPAYIVLKPSLLGGIIETTEWIETAQRLKINWWVTSALESNIGLNAIAQWINTFKPQLVQGLGTGNLYENNIPSPLHVDKACLFYDPRKNWTLDEVFQD